jgi:hypothetical protein
MNCAPISCPHGGVVLGGIGALLGILSGNVGIGAGLIIGGANGDAIGIRQGLRQFRLDVIMQW